MNNSNNSNELLSLEVNSKQMAIAKTFLYGIILVWSLLGNILVMVVILKNTRLKTNFNFLIVNMAVSDLLIPCLALPMKIADSNLRQFEWLVDGVFGNILCKVCYFVADMSTAVSAFSLVIIAVNRFFAIAFPMRGRLSKSQTFKLIACTWIMAAMILSPYFYTFQLVQGEEWTMCLSKWSPAFDDVIADGIFVVVITVFLFTFPCIVNSVLYSLMLIKLRQNSKNMVFMLNQQQHQRRQRKDKNIFTMTIVVMFLYIALWGPFFCTLIVLTFFVPQTSENMHSIETAVVIVQFLGYLNSAVNPCIYFYFLRNLRQGVKQLFRQQLSKQIPESAIQMASFRTRASLMSKRDS